MNNKKTKIVMVTMFKNEAKVIKRMLDSCLPFVDYYIMQDNGSTDGTTDIAKQFLLDNKLSGEIYFCEEGWKGFGWNRDHLIQYCQNANHECDWILKMDCDEVLEVDSDFDWSIFNDTTIQSFHVPAVSGTCIYYRAWMWNAKMPWRFNHDPCHETIYCATEGIGENFSKYDLPKSFRQVGYNEGQSWSVPTKFISDSLILEEKMIREQNMLNNIYHFWYIGKSYNDAYYSTAFPLGVSQQKEYARRAIYYFDEYIRHIHKSGKAEFIDETSYMSLIFSAEAYTFLEEYDKAIETYKKAEPFAPGRNDHLFGLALLFQRLEDWNNMHHYTSIMMQPERINPFPNYCNFIDASIYHDGGDRIKNLHNYVTEKLSNKKIKPFFINKLPQKKLFVVDNFYSDPDEIRNFALTQFEYKQDLKWYKGYRSTTHFHPQGIKESFENIMGEKIINFGEGINGCFQLMISSDPQVYHYDEQKWAAMIYLTPNAPVESGTRLHKAKTNNLVRHKLDNGIDEYFNGNFYDSTKWEVADSAANYYNRLVIMDAQCVHSAGPYFGDSFENGRLTHLFFFD